MTSAHAKNSNALSFTRNEHTPSCSLQVAKCVCHMLEIQSQKGFFITKLNEVGWKVRNSEQFCDCLETEGSGFSGERGQVPRDRSPRLRVEKVSTKTEIRTLSRATRR